MTPRAKNAYWKSWQLAARALGVRYNADAVRHSQTAAALGYERSSTAFNAAEFSLVLYRFNQLKSEPTAPPYTEGDREMILLANERRKNQWRLKRLRELFEQINPQQRIHVLRDRFKVELFEQFEKFTGRDLWEAERTMERLAKEYPKREAEAPERRTPNAELRTENSGPGLSEFKSSRDCGIQSSVVSSNAGPPGSDFGPGPGIRPPASFQSSNLPPSEVSHAH